MKRLILLLILFLGACAKENDDSDTSSSVSCPSGVAASSNLPLAPTAEAAVAIHSNGKSTTWNWQLNGTLNTSYSVDVYDVDLFDTTAAQIASLQASGKKVVCYFSGGSSENWRDDFSDFNSEDMGSALDGWDGERWLDVRSQNVLDIMKARIDMAVTKGCDGVEPDNMDGYLDDNEKCFDYSSDEQLAYNRAIANYARSIGLSVGLKNDADQVSDLVSYFDFSVTEQCYEYSECSNYLPFVSADKPVFNAEYAASLRSNPTALCSYSLTNEIRTLVLALELDDSYRHSCD